MDHQVIETVVLAIIFALCVLYIVRKAIAKFSQKGSGCGGCSGCGAKQEDSTVNGFDRKDM
jgi:hypothetical protein